jgi:hypothetical protein
MTAADLIAIDENDDACLAIEGGSGIWLGFRSAEFWRT